MSKRGHKESAFCVARNVLYFDLRGGHTGVSIYKNVYLIFVHFTICKLYLNK